MFSGPQIKNKITTLSNINMATDRLEQGSRVVSNEIVAWRMSGGESVVSTDQQSMQD